MPALITTESIVATNSHRLIPKRFDRPERLARYAFPCFDGLAQEADPAVRPSLSEITVVRVVLTSAGFVSKPRATALDTSSASISPNQHDPRSASARARS